MCSRSQGFDSSNYMTIEAIDNIEVQCLLRVLNYSYDGYEWQVLFPRDNLYISSGSSVYFKNTLKKGEQHGNISIDGGAFNLRGNCMSLVFGDKANENFSLRGYNNVFMGLFQNNFNLINVDEKFLPATELDEYCYFGMFNYCKNLKNAPRLPASELSESCYCSMFEMCDNLLNAPELPATTLADNCYNSMFSNCRSLVDAPELPATTLADNCYNSMFHYCTSLVYAPELPATILVTSCYDGMFYGCRNLNYIKALFLTNPSTSYTNNWVYYVSSTGTFVKNPAATWDVVGDYGIPEGWTVKFNGEEGSIDTWLQFPLYFDFDACETGFGVYCYRNPDDTSIELERVLKDALMQYGDKVDDSVAFGYILQKSALNNLGIKIFFKGIEVEKISITGYKTIQGNTFWEAIFIQLGESYNVEFWGELRPINYIYIQEDGKIFIEI